MELSLYVIVSLVLLREINGDNGVSELDDLVSSTTADYNDLLTTKASQYASTTDPPDRTEEYESSTDTNDDSGTSISWEEETTEVSTDDTSYFESTEKYFGLDSTAFPHHHSDDHHHEHDTDHYTVAKLDFDSVSFPFYVTLWLLSASFAKIGMNHV